MAPIIGNRRASQDLHPTVVAPGKTNELIYSWLTKSLLIVQFGQALAAVTFQRHQSCSQKLLNLASLSARRCFPEQISYHLLQGPLWLAFAYEVTLFALKQGLCQHLEADVFRAG